MSGQEILIEQLRADVERLTAERDAAFELGRLVGRADVAKYARAIGEIESVVGIVGAVPMPQTVQAVRDLVSRAEKAERFIATADSEWKARAEKAERERDEWKARHDTLADVSRKCIATAERERDEARAERDALHVALELAEVEVALDRSWCRICRTECRGAHRGRREHMHAAECVLNIRAHAAKAVKP